MNQINHKERSSSLLRLESALGMDQNRPITVCNDSHYVFVHIHLGAKEPRKSFSLNSGRLQADRKTSPCCQGPRQTGNGGEICEVIPSTAQLEGGLIVPEISFSATSAKWGSIGQLCASYRPSQMLKSDLPAIFFSIRISNLPMLVLFLLNPAHDCCVTSSTSVPAFLISLGSVFTFSCSTFLPLFTIFS